MSRFDNEIRITSSVLDRLIDYEPEVKSEAPASRQKSLRDLKAAVKRDLEWLLNSRQVVGGVPEELKETSHSLAAFGLPDFTGVSLKNVAEQAFVRRTIERAISLFEPRLEDVMVILIPGNNGEQVMRFRIDARLKIEPAPEPVTFDTLLQLDNGQYVVKEQR
ncbi:MAG: type VI secretion system baseplate subunit TssE [Blastocatellia bacterium]|nr:type VI secretion system baseplate subunit TssE [Blastocatellia bacterium]